MNKYAGTQSEKNLMTAFAGESEARNKYTFFASVAKKQGFEQSRVPIKQYLQKFPKWGRFGVTSVTPFLLLPVHPEGYTPAHHT